MTCAGGLDVRQGAASGPVDVAGSPASGAFSAPGTDPTAVNPAQPRLTAAPPALDPGGAACPSCGSRIDALALASSGMRLIVAALACRACGWGMTRADLRHLKTLPEDAE